MPFFGKRNMSMKKHEKGDRIHITVFLKGLSNSKKGLGSIFNTQ